MFARPKIICVALFATAVLAGCGGKDATTATAPATVGTSDVATTAKTSGDAPAATKPTTTLAAATQSNPAGLPNACQLVTKADIASSYGTTAADGTLDKDADNQCTFEISGQTKAGKVGLISEVSVQVDTRDSDSSYAATKKIFPTIQKLDVGDEGWYYDLVVAQVHIMKGKYELVVSGPIFDDKEVSKQMAVDLGKVALARLK
jgi:hypothetical protein